ncbi:DUF2268 domain-containing putative Zn-dependent protease [Huintestinicola sp.]|uniref:DUF2268 domain-containing putative Zn-dependent protease n=1 Tax=Huintestinicola sp. TaxID=2981661 RepID=UPI003D7E39D0
MKIEIINTVNESLKYIEAVFSGQDKEQAWENIVVAPYWEKLFCYAPFDLSDRKPAAVMDMTALKRQAEIMQSIDIGKLEKEFERVTKILPNFDDDPITVVLFPSDNGDITVNEKQNGVVGTSLFGNLYIKINPLIDGYEDWIKYVFAHEYHHTVWGNYWYVLNGGKLDGSFINSLFIDGEADSFALEMYPSLKPLWIFGLSEDDKRFLWEKHYKNIVNETNVDYDKYMFGSEEDDIPWCAGYAIGYMLVQNCLKQLGGSVTEILKNSPAELFGTN